MRGRFVASHYKLTIGIRECDYAGHRGWPRADIVDPHGDLALSLLDYIPLRTRHHQQRCHRRQVIEIGRPPVSLRSTNHDETGLD